jgi:hypothetical protein
VVIDSTPLFPAEKPSEVVSPGFHKAWEKYAAEFNLTLVVPETVRGEIIYRQTHAAQEARTRATASLQAVSGFTAKSYVHKATEEKVTEGVAARFDGWIGTIHARLEPTPVDNINWRDLIACAVWRRTTFANADVESTKEKGFRDALVMEVFKAVCAREGAPVEVVLITSDPTLTAAVQGHPATSGRRVYPTLAELATDLRLLKGNTDKEFVAAIQQKASAKFFAPGNSDSLFLKDDIRAKLKGKFSQQFTLIPEPTGLLALVREPLAPSVSWEGASLEMALISSPEFERIVGKEYHWKSVVKILQLFRRRRPTPFTLGAVPTGFESFKSPTFQNPYSFLTPATDFTYGTGAVTRPVESEPEPDRVYVRNCAARWKVKVRDNGAFDKPVLLGLDFENATFEKATDEDLRLLRVTKDP